MTIPHRHLGALLAMALLLVALALGSPVNAAQDATKKTLRIDADTRGSETCTGKFFLTLGVDGDLGKVTCTSTTGDVKRTPDGLEYRPSKEKTTFTGKDGTLVLRSDVRTWELGFGTYKGTSGTWSVVSGTGAYAGMRGRGPLVGVHSSAKHLNQTRYAGSVTLPA